MVLLGVGAAVDCGDAASGYQSREEHCVSDIDSVFPLEGGCDCGQIRYRVTSAPLVVHCCHCRWCQRESGAAFALNAMIEADRVVHLQAEPELVETPSASGKGQRVARCPKCRIALWSNYSGAVRISGLSGSGRWINRITCRPISTSSFPQNSRGWCCRRRHRPWRNTTIGRLIGRRRAWRVGTRFNPRSRRIRRRGGQARARRDAES